MSLWFLSCSLDTRQAVGADVKFILFKRMLGKMDRGRDRDRAARNGWDSNRLLFQHSSHSSVTFLQPPTVGRVDYGIIFLWDGRNVWEEWNGMQSVRRTILLCCIITSPTTVFFFLPRVSNNLSSLSTSPHS
jgi:hypothetical protein